MTETVESNAEISTLLWDNLIEAGKKASEDYSKIVSEAAQSYRETVVSMISVFFARNPEVEAIAWSQTDEEYDDNTYGGYNWVEIRPRFFKDKMDEATKTYAEQYNDYYQDFVDNDRYGFGRQSVPGLVTRVYEDIRVLEGAIWSHGNALSRELFGTDGVVASRGGINYFGPDDEIKTP